MECLVCKKTVLPRWPGTKWNASEGIWRVSLGPRPFTVIIWPFSTRLIPSFDAVSFILSLFRNDYSSPILLQWRDVKNWNETRICHLHFGTAIGRTWKVCEQLELFLWDTLNGMELNLLIWSCLLLQMSLCTHAKALCYVILVLCCAAIPWGGMVQVINFFFLMLIYLVFVNVL